jgi:hypothetical protein
VDQGSFRSGEGTDGVVAKIGEERLEFFTLEPCRLIDTRNPAGPLGGPALQPGAARLFVVTGANNAVLRLARPAPSTSSSTSTATSPWQGPEEPPHLRGAVSVLGFRTVPSIMRPSWTLSPSLHPT